jgi:carbon storage regulator CsrA
MLVLSRKLGERITIGDDIEVKVLAVQGGRVRLGITCPTDVRILRAELAPHERPAAAVALAGAGFAFDPAAHGIS